MDKKWFLSSSAVLGGLVLTSQVIGPLFGLSEIQVDSITGALATLIVITGRDNASAKLTLTPEVIRRIAEAFIAWRAQRKAEKEAIA